MKNAILSLGFIIIILQSSGAICQGSSELRAFERPERQGGLQDFDCGYGSIPLYFVPNQGQLDESVLFSTKTANYSLLMTRQGFVFSSDLGPSPLNGCSLSENTRLVFLGAKRNPDIQALEPTEHTVNYFIGSDPVRWHTDLPSYRAAVYKDLYPGIDLKVYGVEGRVEYDWIVKPGAKPETIRFEYQGAKSVLIDSQGNLDIETRFGKLLHRKPVGYQIVNGQRIERPSGFIPYAGNITGFSVGNFDQRHDLVIDPVLTYSTYLGGSGDDIGRDMAVDGTGAVYIVGWTNSTNFPTRNPYQKTLNGTSSDVFVSKVAPAGNALIFSTYLGGSGADEGNGIALDATKAIYLTGKTLSPDFPVVNPFQGQAPGKYAFVAKLAPRGNKLIYSTYLGGGGNYGKAIAVDGQGAAYITGQTDSANFPLLNPFQNVIHGLGEDAFVTKLKPAGNALEYSTFLGGSLYEEGRAIAVDGKGSAYVTGITDSRDFPLKQPFQNKALGSADVFITKFTPQGDKLVYSTYLGGRWWDWSYGIAVDGAGSAYLTGETYSPDFPIKNAFQKKPGGLLDVFITKLSASGRSLVFSTYLGGSDYEEAGMIAVGKNGVVSVTGETYSSDFPLKNPYQNPQSAGDAFVALLSPSGAGLLGSTCLGGAQRDRGVGTAIDAKGAVYVLGWTYSSDFPIFKPYQTKYKGGWDTFLAKFNFSTDASNRLESNKNGLESGLPVGRKRQTPRQVLRGR